MKKVQNGKLKENFLYISFHKASGLLGRAIGLWTLGQYAHAEFIYNGEILLANPGGVRKKQYKPNPNADIYEVNYIVNIEKVIEFCEKQIGKGYDYKGIALAQFLMGQGHNDDEWFCSELCLGAIDYAMDYKLTYGKKPLKKKGYQKFNPQRLYVYLLKRELILGGKINER